jgi:hypothetical protein
MSEIKVSKRYWDSLSQAEQTFLSENVYDFGLMTCKKVVRLAQRFNLPIERIVNAYRYNDRFNKALGVLLASNWIVFDKNDHMDYLIWICDGIGITQKLSKYNANGHLEMIWHN